MHTTSKNNSTITTKKNKHGKQQDRRRRVHSVVCCQWCWHTWQSVTTVMVQYACVFFSCLHWKSLSCVYVPIGTCDALLLSAALLKSLSALQPLWMVRFMTGLRMWTNWPLCKPFHLPLAVLHLFASLPTNPWQSFIFFQAFPPTPGSPSFFGLFFCKPSHLPLAILHIFASLPTYPWQSFTFLQAFPPTPGSPVQWRCFLQSVPGVDDNDSVCADQRVITKPDWLSVQQVFPDLSHGDKGAASRERFA